MPPSHSSSGGPLAAVNLDDRRGMRSLLGCLEGDPLGEAVELLRAGEETVVLCTGFPIVQAKGRPETDGPLGSVFLARALAALGRRVMVASWERVLEAMEPHLEGTRSLAVPVGRPAPFPVGGQVVAVEACGRVAGQGWLDMRGRDVGALAPHFETLVGLEIAVAVGDGGNELGFGSAPASWRAGRCPAPESCARVLLPATVSNWGALALASALHPAGLPEDGEWTSILKDMVGDGLVDGFSGAAEAREDGRPASEGEAVVRALRALRAPRP